jgi:uncharacterized protein YndB with AHSA1/START domain
VPAARRPGTRVPVAKKPAVRKALARTRERKPRPGREPSGTNELRLAGVGTAAVLRATGRPWSEWLAVLDRAGARSLSHKDIALLLSRKFGVPDWWGQMVTVGYEQARGLRAAGQRADGFAATATRTVETNLDRLYDAWKDPSTRARWLLEAAVEVRRSSDGKSLRMTWQPGESSVDVSFTARGPGKSRVAVDHGKLANATAARRQKAFWSAALERLKAFLESGK